MVRRCLRHQASNLSQDDSLVEPSNHINTESETGNHIVRKVSEKVALAVQPTIPVKRPRGRPSKASLVAESISSASTPKSSAYWSASMEHDTPPTSTVPTPAPGMSPDLTAMSSTSKPDEHMEITIRTVKPSEAKDTARALAMSKFAPRKRKRYDDEEEEEEEAFLAEQRDAKLARQLQEEEYNKPGVGSSHKPTPGRTRRSLMMTEPTPPAATFPSTTDRKGKGKAATKPFSSGPFLPASRQNPFTVKKGNKKQAVDLVNDSEDSLSAITSSDDEIDEEELDEEEYDEESDLYEESDDDDVPLSKKKTSQTDTRDSATPMSPEVPLIPTDLSSDSDADEDNGLPVPRRYGRQRRGRRMAKGKKKLEHYHPKLTTMWATLDAMPILKSDRIEQPSNISRTLKPFQLEGVAWMKKMEEDSPWKGGILGDEMGLGKTIQAVSLIMSDFPAKKPSLVLAPPVALMQWMNEISSYTDGTLKTFVYHGSLSKAKAMTVKELHKFDVIIMSYNSLESMYRKQEKGFKRKGGMLKEESIIHATHFHRIILDEAHCIKSRTAMTAKACFALQTDYRWCLTGTPLQNRIGEFFSLLRFLQIEPFASYMCKSCKCEKIEWDMDEQNRCKGCNHTGMRHVSVFNYEFLNPIQRHGNRGEGAEALKKLRKLTNRIMLRRLKKDHTDSMELPVKEIVVDRQFFGEEENDFANSIMTSGQREFDTYVAQGVMLNNYANIFGLIMQMRQIADHPDLILKKGQEGGQNIMVCCICDEPAEEAIQSKCKHDFCRQCATDYLKSTEQPDCPRCHIPLNIDLGQPDVEQDELLMKKTSIINRIKMEKWTSSTKIELLVHNLHSLRSNKTSHKSIIFSQFTSMLQLIEWRLRRAGITTVMLDGSMTPAQRAASIDHFMNNVDVECFLVSLRAGGVALNLTEASRVFIVDPWWNPAAEWQSADRVHRIGQTRPCIITRLCIEDSVESRMVLLQEKKTKMFNSTVDADDAAMQALTPADLQFLFNGH